MIIIWHNVQTVIYKKRKKGFLLQLINQRSLNRTSIRMKTYKRTRGEKDYDDDQWFLQIFKKESLQLHLIDT